MSLERFHRWSLYGLLFFLPFSKAAIEIFFVFALLFFLLKRLAERHLRLPQSRSLTFLYLYLGFCAVSVALSGPYFLKSLDAFFFKWLEYAFLFLMVREASQSPPILKRLVSLLLLSSCILSLDGLYQYFAGNDLLRGRPLIVIGHIAGVPPFHYVGAVTASLEHYNNLGTYLMCTLLITTALLSSPHAFSGKVPGTFTSGARHLQRPVLASLIFLQAICFLLTFSRGAWLAFLAGLLLMLFLLSVKVPGTDARQRCLAPKTVLLLTFFFIATIFAWPVFRERIFYAFHSYYGEQERSFVWSLAWQMIQESPWFGKGVGTFMDYASLYSSGLITKYAHNCYLQIWAESGTFALLSFIFFIACLLGDAFRAFQKSADYLLLGLMAAVTAFLLHAYINTQFYSLQTATLFWCLIGAMDARQGHRCQAPVPGTLEEKAARCIS